MFSLFLMFLVVNLILMYFITVGKCISHHLEHGELSDDVLDFYLAFAELNACQNVAIHYQDYHYRNLLFRIRKKSKGFPTSFVNYTQSGNLLQTAAPSLHVVFGHSGSFLEQTFSGTSNDDMIDANDFWLIQMPDVEDGRYNESQIVEAFDNVTLNYNSLTFLWSLDKSRPGWIVLTEVYKIHMSSPKIEILPYGTWNASTGLSLKGLPIWERRADLKRHTFRIAANFNPPYITKVTENCRSSRCFQGMFPDVWHALAETMNYTFFLNPPPDGAWGTKLPDGSWNGMIGQLYRDEIDIAPAEFTVTALRSQVVDFSLPITESHQKLFVKNPAESFNWTAFVEPLSWSCWGVIALFILVVPLGMSHAIKMGNDREKGEFTLSKSFCFVAGAMTIARGWSVTPWSIQNRIIFFSIMLGGTLVFWHWEAMIISFLAVRTTVLPFSSMEEMFTKTDFRVAVQPGTSYVDTFRYSNNPMLQQIWTERIEPYIDGYPKTKIGLSLKIIEETSNYALFDNFYTTITYEPYKKCQIIAVSVAYFPVQFAYAFQKKSPYFDAFWYQLNKMKERGATKQILEKYEAEKQICPDYSGKPLGFGQCFTAFIALMGGMVLGFISLLMEKLMPQRSWSRINRTVDDLNMKKSAIMHGISFASTFTKHRDEDDQYVNRMKAMEKQTYHETELRKHQKALADIRSRVHHYS